MNQLLGICTVMLWLSSLSVLAQPDEAVRRSGRYRLVWADEFDYHGLPDSTKWSFDTEGNAWQWGNNEEQFYTRERLQNAEVKDGNLYIHARHENFEGRSYSSARLISQGKGDWQYGKVEVRAKLPAGRGLWPAIWMLPSGWNYASGPAAGEIDIMEHVGYAPDTILGVVHLKKQQQAGYTSLADTVFGLGYDRFHLFELHWTPSKIRLRANGRTFLKVKKRTLDGNTWPFDQPYFLLLNLAVGGTWGGLMGIDDSAFPATLMVDYVRVYQKQ